MTDVIRKSYFYIDAQIREYKLKKPLGEKIWYFTADEIFNAAHAMTDAIAKKTSAVPSGSADAGDYQGQRSDHSSYL